MVIQLVYVNMRGWERSKLYNEGSPIEDMSGLLLAYDEEKLLWESSKVWSMPEKYKHDRPTNQAYKHSDSPNPLCPLNILGLNQLSLEQKKFLIIAVEYFTK